LVKAASSTLHAKELKRPMLLARSGDEDSSQTREKLKKTGPYIVAHQEFNLRFLIVGRM